MRKESLEEGESVFMCMCEKQSMRELFSHDSVAVRQVGVWD